MTAGPPSGGGGGSGDPAPTPPATPPANPPAPARQPDSFATEFEAFMRGHNNDPREAAYQLFREGFRNRDARRGLEEQLTDLRTQLPPQGAVVLQGDDATRYNEYRALNLTPAQVRERLTEHATLQTEVTESRRDKALREVAEVSGFNFKPLARVGKELEYTIKDVEDATAQGGKRRVAYVVTVDTATKVKTETPLADYAKTNWDDVLPALQASNGQASGHSGGPIVPRQPSQGQGAQQSVAEAYTSSAYAGSGPQKPKQGA